MEIENSEIEIQCDNCHADLTNNGNRIQRECYTHYCGTLICNTDEGWLDFCNVACSLEYLKKHKGIRWFYDNEGYCDREGKFCAECPVFDPQSKICNNDKYWAYCKNCAKESELGHNFEECKDCPVGWGKEIITKNQVILESNAMKVGVFRCL